MGFGAWDLQTAPTRILLIRHAPTDAGGRLCGSFDVPVSPAGRLEIDALVRRVSGHPAPAALLTSTLRRAREVADALGRVWDLSPQAADWAREIHCGEVEGMPLTELQRQRPELWHLNETQADDSFAWPGGESYAAFRRRVVDGLATTAAMYAGRRVAIVTHAGVISQVMGVIRARPACVWAPDRPHPLTATEIVWENGGPKTVLSYNVPGWY